MAAKKHRARVAVSNSFPPGEIRLLRYILTKLPSIRGMEVIVRNDCYSSLARKILRMDEAANRRVEDRKSEDRLAQVVEDT